MKLSNKIIIFSLLFSLPINILFVLWSTSVAKQYLALEHFQFHPLKGARLKKLGDYEFHLLFNTIYRHFYNVRNYDINLFIENKKLNRLNTKIPIHAKENQKAAVLIKGKPLLGKVRYRGDNIYHWLYPEKSWRFKTSKKTLYHDVRKINFIIPKKEALINNLLSYKLAKIMGILAPKSELVNMSVNGKNNGIKLMAEQIDESFLRNNKRMPNDIYKGDLVASKVIRNAPVDLFENASVWTKSSINNHYLQDNKKPLRQLLLDISKNNFNLVDIKTMAKFALLIDLMGTYHLDEHHNWLLYYDNYYEKFFPILWDSAAWLSEWPALWPNGDKHVNIISSKLLHNIYNDYNFLINKYQQVLNFFQQQDKLFIEELNKQVKIAKKYIKINGYTINWKHKLSNEQESRKAVEQLQDRAIKRLNLIKSTFVGKVNRGNYQYSLNSLGFDIAISGKKLVKEIIIKYSGNPQVSDVKIQYLQQSKIKEVSDVAYKVEANSLIIKQYLLPNMENKLLPKSKTWYLKHYSTATYKIIINTKNSLIPTQVYFSFANLKNEQIEVKQVNEIELKSFVSNLNNIVTITKQAKIKRWQGIIELKGHNTIKDNLIIEKGTTIILDNNATLKVLGKVTAKGTKNNPIIFKAKNKAKPWASIVLMNQKANNSFFKHCIFEDGSGDKGDLYEYTAMLSVHNVKNVRIENCTFQNSHITDDMVHIIYSDVLFKKTTFKNSLSDALDVDISNVEIDNCSFIKSGNDAIDLMSSNAIVKNTIFNYSADKAISIGEGSQLLAINNKIENSAIAMQSKDTSKAYVYNSTFINNNKAIDAYHKNWRYSEGGNIVLDRCVLIKNKETASVGKKSKIVIHNSNIDKLSNIFHTSLVKKKIVISYNDELIKTALQGNFFEQSLKLVNKNVRGYFE